MKARAARESGRERILGLAAGLWFGIALLKFGNPVILDKLVQAPANLPEFIFTAWPVAWGYALGVLVLLAALPLFKLEFPRPAWPAGCLVFWLFWQFISSTRTIDPTLTAATLPHFAVCAGLFALGLFAFAQLRERKWFWIPLLCCFIYVLYYGFDQQHGGLEATRRAFYEQPNWQEAPKEFIQKMSSNRIFSTLVYPNALAGAILLFLPVLLWMQWTLTARWPRIPRGVALGLFAYLALGCLYWTGSKGGWLVALALCAVVLLHAPMARQWRMLLIVAGLLVGLSVFAIRFSAYFQKGAPSVGARFDYWTAAVQTFQERPIFGSGPGTFQSAYSRIKPPEAEMTRLAHNDYIQQASDSGLPGFIAYLAFIGATLILVYRRCQTVEHQLVWLGLLGWALQGLMEFALYIPALSWAAFFFMGWLWSLPPAAPPPLTAASAEPSGRR